MYSLFLVKVDTYLEKIIYNNEKEEGKWTVKKFGANMAQNYFLDLCNFVSSYYFRDISDASFFLELKNSFKKSTNFKFKCSLSNVKPVCVFFNIFSQI